MIAGEAGDFGQALEMSHALRPQVIILDMHMPGGDRIDPNHFRSQLHASAKVLAISIWNDQETAVLAEQFGAAKLIDEMDIAKDLIPAIFQLVPRSPDS
jgi:DNA-binding NarL/FixJ family response regulator